MSCDHVLVLNYVCNEITSILDHSFGTSNVKYNWISQFCPSYTSQGPRDFSIHSVKTGSKAHVSSYPTGTGGSFPRGKADGALS
jgi:hypothetical protein